MATPNFTDEELASIVRTIIIALAFLFILLFIVFDRRQ